VSANVWNVVQGFGWPALLGAVIGGALAWPQHCTHVGYFSLNVSTRTTVCTSQHFPLVHLRSAFEFSPVYLQAGQVVLEGAFIMAIVAAVISVVSLAIIDGFRAASARGRKSKN
jgi:hypothetical protein